MMNIRLHTRERTCVSANYPLFISLLTRPRDDASDSRSMRGSVYERDAGKCTARNSA